MEREPLKISWDDLKSQQVEGRLKEQATVRTTKEHYERANVVAPVIAPPKGLKAWLLKSIVYLSLFGLAGGALGWTLGELLNVRPDRVEEARQLLADLDKVNRAEAIGKYTPENAARARARIGQIGAENAYFTARVQHSLAGDAVALRQQTAQAADRASEFRADLLLFSVSGLFIAIALASAERVVERDWHGATIDAFTGAMLGLVGGVAVAFAMPPLESLILGASAEGASLTARMTARAAVWMLLGAFVVAAPGIASRSLKRTVIGIAGGLAGGLIGGLLFEPLSHATGSPSASRLLGLAIIGGCGGLSMGWLENVAKQGWLRVVAGLIAGKQFILYRNPTFVGSAPMSHIYLFRDAQVGRRHAAIYQIPGGGFEIEDLPLGGPTLVNDQPIKRHRLRAGDRIRIGRTTMVFEEKTSS